MAGRHHIECGRGLVGDDATGKESESHRRQSHRGERGEMPQQHDTGPGGAEGGENNPEARGVRARVVFVGQRSAGEQPKRGADLRIHTGLESGVRQAEPEFVVQKGG